MIVPLAFLTCLQIASCVYNSAYWVGSSSGQPLIGELNKADFM